jgi:alpha-L-arabinofuranosidase
MKISWSANVSIPRNPVKNIFFSTAHISFALLLGWILLASCPLHAQLKTKVTVDLSQTKATVYTTSIGIAADRWDTTAYDSDTVQMLRDAGITDLRFPGNDGIDALYHWSTGTITNPYTDDKAPAFPKEKQFPAAVPVIDALGTAIVSVNYGTNADGSGGGEPAEAAAWVAYANGNPSSTQVIGKDSKGNDWKTVGFWAGIRASSPLPTDDGYNFLRIGHASPIGIQLWTIGNEPWGNGFYGQAHTVGSDADNSGKYGESPSPEPDLHDGKVPTSKDWGRRQGDSKVGPAAYGAAVVQYAKAMKAVDPTIMIGAFVMRPPYANDANQVGKNWNADMLKEACGSMDFSAAMFYEGKGEPPHWVDNVDERDLLTEARDEMDATRYYPNQNAVQHDFALLGHDLIEKYKKFCPKGHAPQLAITGLGLPAWLPPHNPATPALFAADSIAWLLETGAYTVIWSPIHALSPTFLDNKNQPQPAYYGIELLHTIASPGDVLVGTTSQMDTLTVHATKRRDGGLGLLLINKDLTRSTSVTVSVDGYNFATKGTRYDYGKPQIEAHKDVAEASIDGLGPTFTVNVPLSSVTAIVIPKGQ